MKSLNINYKILELKKLLFIMLTLLCGSMVNGQVKPLDSVFSLVERNDDEQLKQIVERYSVNDLNQVDRGYYYIAAGGIDYINNDFEKAYSKLLKAKENQSNKRIIYKANDLLIFISNATTELQFAPASVMQENLEIAQQLRDPKLSIRIKHHYMFKEIQSGEFDKAIEICYELKKICEQNELVDQQLDVEFNLGTLHYYRSVNDSALYYYKRNLAIFEHKKDTFNIATRLNNLAMLQTAIGLNEDAVNNLIKAEQLAKKFKDRDFSVTLLRNIADAQVAAGNLDEAIDYYNEFISENDSLKRTSIAKSLSEMQTKYETKEKELENAELQSKNLENTNKIYLLLFVLVMVVGIGFFLFNRMRQKQALLAAAAETQKQREEKLLKNAELASIDAMISGQEKERKKIAQDLHDDIGSSLTTARMCIENVVQRSKEEESIKVLENAYALLNETYSKVRNISHAQKSSILNAHGLIGSLEEFADRINAGKSLNVEIIHHGMKGSLSNSLELGLFRIIQELLNNTIKHSQAKHASIILTGYEDHIDIIVEDDGNGFTPDLKNQEGTGLKSIKSRIINLEGTMEIDTKLNRGTTINIEIPLI